MRLRRVLFVAPLLAACASGPTPPRPAAPAAKPAPAAAAAQAPGPDATYWEKRTDLIKAPPPPEPRPLPLPPITRWKGPGGLDVMVVPRRDLPVASVTVAVKASGYDEKPDQMGVAEFTAAMLRKGTQGRSADEIAEAIDFVGGSLDTSAGEESSNVGCSVLSKDLPLCLDLVADVLTRPTFPEEEMREIRDAMLGGLSQRYDSPGALARTHFHNLVFGDDHPDGRVLTPEQVARIKRDDLVRFWKTFYRPNNSILVIAGDVDPAKLRADLAKRFGRWQRAAVPARPAFKLPERKGARLLLVDKDDLTQATMVFGHHGIRHADPAYYAVSVMNYVLGGSDFSSRLMVEVRSRRGLTYGISSSFGATLYEGAFGVTAATKNESVWDAFMAAVGELRRMKTEGPTAVELAKARGYVAGSYPFQLQSVHGIASSVLDAELHGLGVKYVEQFATRIGGVSVDEAKRAAVEHLHPEQLVVVIVGRGDAIAPQLEKNGMKFERINYRDPISFAARVKLRQGASAAVSSGDATKARALIERGLAAQGGADRLRAIKDVTIVKEGTRRQGDQVADIFATTYLQRPGKARLEQEVVLAQGKMKIVMVVTPQSARGGPAGQPLQPLPALNEQRVRTALFEDINFILLNILDAKPPMALQLAQPLVQGNRTFDGVTLKLPSGEWTTLYFDRETGLLSRIRSPGDGGVEQIEAIEDYRDVKGFKFSFRQMSLGGAQSNAKVKEIKVDTGLAADLFK